MAEKTYVRITQIRSLIGAKPKARASVRSLGLKRIHHSVVVPDTPQARGYLHAASHLLTVEQVDAPSPDGPSDHSATEATSK